MVNPARAGMILGDVLRRGWFRCKPRASGDDPSAATTSRPCSSVNPARAGMIPGLAGEGP